MSVNTRQADRHRPADLAQPAGLRPAAGDRRDRDGARHQRRRQPRDVHAVSLRTLGAKLSDIKADINLTPGQRSDVPDYKGVPQGYQKVTFTVPAGAQRLDAAIAHPGDGTGELNMTLFDPEGRLAAYTYQSAGEPTNFGHIDVRVPRPAPGPR